MQTQYRRALCFFPSILLVLGACSQSDDEHRSSDSLTISQGTESADMVAPNIDAAATQAVAFSYAITLGVPDRRISALQEKNADACEALGLSRCQIVGMRYNLIKQDRVEASLRFLLAPDVARTFAKQAVSEAEKMDGKLLESQFDGEEVQSGIDQSRERSGTVQDRIDTIERELSGNVKQDRRAQISDELAALRNQLVQERQTRQADQKRLNLSPLDIRYAGASVYSDTPLSQIASEATLAGKGSLTLLFTVLIYLVTVVLPWALVLVLLLLGLRWGSRKAEAWHLRRNVDFQDEQRPGHDPADDHTDHP